MPQRQPATMFEATTKDYKVWGNGFSFMLELTRVSMTRAMAKLTIPETSLVSATVQQYRDKTDGCFPETYCNYFFQDADL